MTRNNTQTYEQDLQFTTTICNMPVEVISKPGLPEWNQLLAASELLAENSNVHPTDRILQLGAHHGALSVFLLRRLHNGYLSIIDHNFLALALTRKTLAANHCQNNVNILEGINDPITGDLEYDIALMQIPKGRPLIRRWLFQSHRSLKSG